MFAVRNKETGKYLKAFNGSFNHASFYVSCAIAEEMLGGKDAAKKARKQNVMAVLDKRKEISWEMIVENMWCLKTPNGGQLYKTEVAVRASIGDDELFESVPVKVIVDKKRKP